MTTSLPTKTKDNLLQTLKNLSENCSCLQVVTLHLVIFICLVSLMVYHVNLTIRDVYKQFNLSTIFTLMGIYSITSILLYNSCKGEILDNAAYVMKVQMSVFASLFLVWIVIRWNITSSPIIPSGLGYALYATQGGYKTLGRLGEELKKSD